MIPIREQSLINLNSRLEKLAQNRQHYIDKKENATINQTPFDLLDQIRRVKVFISAYDHIKQIELEVSQILVLINRIQSGEDPVMVMLTR
jgi:hypothetical protein